MCNYILGQIVRFTVMLGCEKRMNSHVSSDTLGMLTKTKERESEKNDSVNTDEYAFDLWTPEGNAIPI